MKVSTQVTGIRDLDIPLVLVGVLEEAKNDQMLKELYEIVKDTIELGDFKGKKNQTSLVYTKGAILPRRIMLVGLGKEENLTIEDIRKIVGNVSRKIRDLDVKKVGIYIDFFKREKFGISQTVEAVVQSMIMGSFQNLDYRTKDLDKYKHLEEIFIFSNNYTFNDLQSGAKSGQIIADGVNFCRKLSWGPANYITPTKLAEEALRLQNEL